MTSRPFLLGALLWACIGGDPSVASAQIISPGKLASVHAPLEGLRNCTQCHELRKKGIAPARCLDCHEPLARRLEGDRGFHATLAEPDCASCHRDHYGGDFGLVRLDTLSFDHDRTGYAIEGRHGDVACRSCHTAEAVTDPAVRTFKGEHAALDRTFLGLPTSCGSCHQSEDPHGTEFVGRECTDCHDVGGWKGAEGFDHDEAAYRLTGRHRGLTCEACHTGPTTLADQLQVRFRPVSHGSCTSCHEDQHQGSMDGRCETCHTTSGWTRIDRDRVEGRFDHSTTDFDLVGSHASAPCASCHDAEAAGALPDMTIRFQSGTEGHAFPKPERDLCTSCHVDTHDGVLDPDGTSACTQCHGQDEWLPADYGIERHNRDSAFRLDDAHMVVPCATCHRTAADELIFRMESSTCSSCHAGDDVHAGQFPDRSCDTCHSPGSFEILDFPHETTRYPLDGAHAGVDCAACHTPTQAPDGSVFIRYSPLGTECHDCHGGGA